MQPLPFLEAIAWARARHCVLPDIYYGELQGLARALAFSVAGLTSLDQVQAVLDSLVEATANGESFANWKKRVTDPNGLVRLELPAYRLENIFRTNVQSHYARGRAEQQRAVADAFPYLMYDAVNDSRTRPSHAAMDGKVARQDDPLWNTWRPPCGYQCRCRTIALTEKQAARFIEADARRLLDPEAATARANARPDPGWDYDILAEPTEGLRRAITAKATRVDTRLMTQLQNEMDDLRAAWPIKGLARRFPAHDLATMETLLKQYAYRLPGDLPHGVKFVREGGPDDDFYMATDGQGGFWFREVEHQDFNSRRDLFGGLAACAERRGMTREEEYALESLWHEIWHNRQTGMDQAAKLPKEHLARLFAETLNQVVARLTYPRFIERLGGKAQHQAWVMGNGYGYAPLVQRFLRVTVALGLTTEALAGDLATINVQADLLIGTAIVSRLLAKKSGAAPARIQAALGLLDARESLFSAAVGAIKSPL